MATFSTRQAAKQLGLTATAISRYISRKKIPAPKTIEVGGRYVHVWTQEDIEHVRKLLPKIKNGRKTRFQKERQPKEQVEKAGQKKKA
jgi:excisionase family DNA binding protein